jgi:mannose-1-phosphate guanylyltransferase
MEHFYAVVMAGGSGTRFWPLSRKHKPKQTLPILGGATMVRQTVERLFPLFEPRQIFVVTAKEHSDVVRRDLDLIPQENIIDEPTGRDTAAAIGLAATFLRWRDEDAAFAVLPADHFIDQPLRFQAALSKGREAARSGALVTFGIKPRYAATSYGYLQRGEPFDGAQGKKDGVWRVKRFCEKPKADVAQEFLKSGEYYWNGGIFVWEAKTILAAIAKFLPELNTSLQEIAAALGTSKLPSILSREYGKIQRISIDYGVMEKADKVLMVETDFEWDDVGSWSAAADRRARDGAGNAIEGQVFALESKNSLVLSSDPNHLIGVLGLEDFVVVHTPDATLVCPKNRADDLKKLVEEIRAKGLDRHL